MNNAERLMLVVWNFLKRVFWANKLEEVFTPNTVAKLTYINRRVLESDLEKYLSLPGKQIVIYGHSGSGKTTLLKNKLKEVGQNSIKTHCESSTTFNELLLNAFDELNAYYVSERSLMNQNSINSEIKAEYLGISTKIGSSSSESNGEKRIRVVPPQLTPQKLAKFLGEIDCVWVIEDFHKVVEEEKKRIADVIKIFIDAANDYPKVKIVCIGAVGTARELIELDNNLNNRVAELYVQLLTDEEIESIVEKGFNLMTIKANTDLKAKIVYYSNNLASITHQICFDLCFHSDLRRSTVFKRTLRSDSFKEAVNSYVRKNSDTFKKIYDTILCQTYGWHVLKTFDSLEKENLSFEEIRDNIPNTKRPTSEELRNYLEQLGSGEYKEIVRYDRSSHKYSISSPFFKAFLKMKLELEKSEQKATNNKKRNKKNNKYSIDSLERDWLGFDDDFFITYNRVLETLLERDIRIKKEIHVRRRKVE